MISIKGNNANYEGTSADTKPSGVPVNTIFRELDTNCYYYYTGEAWVEIPGGGGGGGGGTDSYNDLENKPQINSVTLSGNKTLSALGIQAELTIDSAPTEDSTNPVESGGVYEALALKQDTLTIDSAPTESSTNPVESGGVYSALADKQDTLTFEGTYNASTNKAATESTVSDAISTAVGNLTKSDVGLSNVTNNEQIKAVSGAVTSGDIVTFGNDGATVADSGKAIETTLTDSNDKIPTSKSIIDNAAGAAKLTGYTTDSSEQTIGATTKITDAIEQLDYRTATNKTNISSINIKLSNIYIQSSEPTGTIPDGAIWLNTATPTPISDFVKKYHIITIDTGSFESGTLAENSTVGSTYDQTKTTPRQNRIRTTQLIATPNSFIINANFTTYELFILYYDADMLYTGEYTEDWVSAPTTITNKSYIGIVVRRLDGNDILPSADTGLSIQDTIKWHSNTII